MDILLLTTFTAILFLLIAAAEPLAARLSIPFSVMLAAVGILIGGGAIFLLRTELTDTLNPIAESILSLPIRSSVFMYVFLPTLIFQATLEMNIRRMLDDWVPILTLAVVAVVAATLTIGYALSWIGGLPLMVGLLIGAIVSTTDPSAVVSIFRSLSAPKRLARIVEGESLLNDAAAIALFGLFMSYVMLGVPNPSLAEALGQFPALILGGVVAGWLVARIALVLMGMFARFETAQISVSVAVPYLAYIGAEQILGASGVIAVVAAGLVLNFMGPGRLAPAFWVNLREVWGLLAHWAGALIFILAALLIPRLLGEVRLNDLFLIGVVVIAAFVARALILFVLLPVLTGLRLSPKIKRPYRIAIMWGGLRGAVTLALALAVTESLRVPVETKRVVGILATGFTLFTLIVQGTTLRSVIGLLGLDKLSPLDRALSNQVVAVALQTVREGVASATENYDLTRETVRSEAKRFGARLDEAVERAEAEDNAEILDRDRITLGLIALAGHEREVILQRFRERAISARLSEQALFDADRLIEGARSGGRTGYQRAARSSLRYGPAFRFAAFLRNRLGLSGTLGRMTADRFEMLLAKRFILRDLHGFIDRRIRRIHGRRVAELLHELLNRRIEAVETALEGLRLQYPGYAEELERRFIRRTALRLEEREYTAMREDGLIGSEVYTELMEDVTRRRQQTEGRPRLDLALRKNELVRQFKLFADLDDAELKRLSREVRTRYVNADHVITRKDTPARSVFFVASGAVEQEVAGQTTRLGRGEMFGQMGVLTTRLRRTEVRAITPTSLLVLDEPGFRRLLKRSAALRQAVRDSVMGKALAVDVMTMPELQVDAPAPAAPVPEPARAEAPVPGPTDSATPSAARSDASAARTPDRHSTNQQTTGAST
ncbi:cyclic nucleotide-binding domain-containing protein [Paracoccus liaowanqingii]|uniref:Cyclic nucleotide-binding domain-containing protein n=1 Tax=Paracoccus liaowanqingii TaxID=2560053 RepID=A0A4P7HMV8_9RHOB|nr:cation:proton antiporter [Paracoccus liaowanqingii]QBX34501.1 cyclic nucleotide-binding domain-containing protein [Paracoccus liaowanqingii]